MRNFIVRMAAASTILLGAASPAHATDGEWAASPPPRLPDSMYITLDRYRYFTDCIASREWTTAEPLFDTRIGSREEGRLLDRIIGGINGTQCSYADRMRMTSMLLRGGIAESRYRQAYGSGPVPPVNADIAPAPEGATFEWVGFNREGPASWLYEFANCLAERETGAVHAVLVTRIGRREERDAYQVLSRRFGTCLAPGRRLRANSLTLRPWLAEAQLQHFRARRADAAR